MKVRIQYKGKKTFKISQKDETTILKAGEISDILDITKTMYNKFKKNKEIAISIIGETNDS